MTHHRKFAVKVLRPQLAAALGTDRFLREIEITATLKHPRILLPVSLRRCLAALWPLRTSDCVSLKAPATAPLIAGSRTSARAYAYVLVAVR